MTFSKNDRFVKTNAVRFWMLALQGSHERTQPCIFDQVEERKFGCAVLDNHGGLWKWITRQPGMVEQRLMARSRHSKGPLLWCVSRALTFQNAVHSIDKLDELERFA